MDFKKKMNHRLTIAVVYILVGAVLVCIDLVNTTGNYFYFAFGFALLLMGERFVWKKALERMPAALRHVYAMFIVLLGWSLFYFEDMGALGGLLGKK